MPHPLNTAAILVIGNEVLSGKVEDINSTYLCRELRALGVEVHTVLIIPDDAERIGSEVKKLSESHTWVFTSGGVGPTHDDITIPSIAAGFAVPVLESPLLLQRLHLYYGDGFTEAHQRMAQVPENTELIPLDESGRFQLQFKNIFIFPGIPRLLQRRFSCIKERFRSPPIFLKEIFLNAEEGHIAEFLEQTLQEFPELDLGSYPNVADEPYSIKLTLESRSADYLESAVSYLTQLLPQSTLLN